MKFNIQTTLTTIYSICTAIGIILYTLSMAKELTPVDLFGLIFLELLVGFIGFIVVHFLSGELKKHK